MNQTQPSVFDSPAYRRSRRAYQWECTFEYAVSLLVTDAFLAKLLGSIGMSDGLIGIVSSIVSLAFIFQLASILIAQRVRNTKRFTTLIHTAGHLLFASLYLVPFLPFARELQSTLTILCILGAYFGKYFVTAMIYKWGNSHVDPHKRAIFSSSKEMISLVFGMIATLLIGYAMDAFEANGRMEDGFVFAAIGILIFTVCDTVCLLLIRREQREGEDGHEPMPRPAPMREVLANTLGNRNYRNVILLSSLWYCAVYFTVGFLGTYHINELGLKVGTVQLINIIANVVRLLVTRPIGKFADRYSFARGIELALVIAAVAFACNCFTSPQTRVFMVIFAVLYACARAGTESNLLNITYSYVDSRYFVQASAIKASISGLCGFGASLLGSFVLETIQKNGNTLLGLRVYGQQLLSLVSLLTLVVAILFNHLVIAKQKRMIQ